MENQFKPDIRIFFGVLFSSLVLVPVVYGFTLTYLWSWFVGTIFQIRQIGIGESIGLVLTIRFVFGPRSEHLEDLEDSGSVKSKSGPPIDMEQAQRKVIRFLVLRPIGRSVSVLIVGWIIKTISALI